MKRWLIGSATFAAATLWLLLLTLVARAVVAHAAPLGTMHGLIGIATLFVFGFLVTGGLAACGVLSAALWPQRIQRSLLALQSHGLRCGLSGVLVVVAETWLITLAGPLAGLVAVLAVAADLVLLAQGFPALAALAGERIGLPDRPRAVVAGTYLVAFLSALPILGWLMAACMVLQAMGAAVQPVVKGAAA